MTDAGTASREPKIAVCDRGRELTAYKMLRVIPAEMEPVRKIQMEIQQLGPKKK